MPFYSEKDKVAELAGVDESVITDELQSQVDQFINVNIRYEGFFESSDYEELFNIDNSSKVILTLENFPVINNSLKLYDNVQSDEMIEVDAECYNVDNKTGIIQLLTNKTVSGVNAISKFTVGAKAVKAIYKYGYETVPTDIIKFANLILAKWIKVREKQANVDGLTRVQIGDYSESRDYQFLSIASESDIILKPMFEALQRKYNKGY